MKTLLSLERMMSIQLELGSGLLHPHNRDHIFFITFINDFNRKDWAYFLKQKSNIWETFKQVKSLVKKQSQTSNKSITIIDMVRCMLHLKLLSKIFLDKSSFLCNLFIKYVTY